jgi:hypothetical protein
VVITAGNSIRRCKHETPKNYIVRVLFGKQKRYTQLPAAIFVNKACAGSLAVGFASDGESSVELTTHINNLPNKYRTCLLSKWTFIKMNSSTTKIVGWVGGANRSQLAEARRSLDALRPEFVDWRRWATTKCYMLHITCYMLCMHACMHARMHASMHARMQFSCVSIHLHRHSTS